MLYVVVLKVNVINMVFILFCLILGSEILMISKLTLVDDNSVRNSENDKVRKRYLDAGSSRYLYYFQVRLFHLDPSTLFGHAHFLLI